LDLSSDVRGIVYISHVLLYRYRHRYRERYIDLGGGTSHCASYTRTCRVQQARIPRQLCKAKTLLFYNIEHGPVHAYLPTPLMKSRKKSNPHLNQSIPQADRQQVEQSRLDRGPIIWILTRFPTCLYHVSGPIGATGSIGWTGLE
jgi:hypothetical protein